MRGPALAALLALAAALPAQSAFAAAIASPDSGATGAPPPPPAASRAVMAQMPAHPALWLVHGAKGTAYLFGSFHALPPNVDWRTKEIDAATTKADAFVFEISLDDAVKERLQSYVKQRGFLAEGKHLHDMLSPAAATQLDSEVKAFAIDPAAIDRMRPWLALVVIDAAAIRKQNYTPKDGIEVQLEAEARNEGRPIIALETPEQQLAMLVPDDPRAEVEQFESELLNDKDERGAGDELGPLLDAWMKGNVARLGKLTGREFAPFPEARRHLIDERNRHFADRIAALLGEPKTYFVTVGAAHLVGPLGVPKLLRDKGFRVEGP